MVLASLLSTLTPPTFLLVIFLIVTFSIGRRILLLFKTEYSELEEFLISTALGAFFLINFTIALGTFHLIYKEAYILLVVAVILLSLKQIKRLWSLTSSLINNVKKKLKPNLTGLLLAAYLLFILANLLPPFAPVMEVDSLSYHLAFAKIYANTHQLTYLPWHTYTTMPQGMTMLYTISELFSKPSLSPLIAYFFSIFASLAIYAIVKRHYSETAALIASLLFFTSPSIVERLRQPMVDLSLTYFFLLAVLVFFKYTDERNDNKKTGLIVLLSILAGAAISIKLTGAFAAGALFMGVALSWLIHRQRISVKHAIIFCMVTLLLASPWLIRGFVHTGNPLYPQAYSIFGGKYLDSSLTQLYSNYHHIVGLERNLPNALLVYWNMTFKSRAFDSTIGLNPFLLMILPLIVLFYRQIKERKKWVLLFAMSTTILIVQFWVHPVLRYMFPAIALATICAATIMGELMKNKLLKITIILLIGASLAFNAALFFGINAKNIQYFISGENQSEFYSKLKTPTTYGASMWINENTPKDSVVMLVNDQRGYFLDRKYIISSPYLKFIDYGSMNSTDNLLERLNELGITYILINDKKIPANNSAYTVKATYDTYLGTADGGRHAYGLLNSVFEEHSNLEYDERGIKVYKILATAS